MSESKFPLFSLFKHALICGGLRHITLIFFQQMSLERITLHSLQGKILVQVLVSMPAEMLIRYSIFLCLTVGDTSLDLF